MRKFMETPVTGKVQTNQVEKILANEALSKSQKMKDMFDLGLDVKQITAHMQVRYNFVYNVISNYVNMNGLTVEKEAKAGKKEQIIAMFLDGKSNKEIAIDLKTNSNYVFNVLKAYKLANPIVLPEPEVVEVAKEEAVAE
jgi:DNA-binding NarL/FixJ family response regulator